MDKRIAALIAAAVMVIVGLFVVNKSVGYNDAQHWQVVQPLSGDVWIRETPGIYWRGFATVWSYPYAIETTYSNHPEESEIDDSVQVTFNDGGNAQVSSYVKITLPVTPEQRLLLHRDFMGNPDNITRAVRAHWVNCAKASGPVMSASENQASRKAEFNAIVEEQLIRGLFKMKRTEIELSDMTEMVDGGVDADGNKVVHEKKAKVQATEIVNDAQGLPIVIQESPLLRYGLGIGQFSITGTDYDQQTLLQFAAKKESYLNAEKSKAQRQEEVQQRLMIEEKGRRQVAEIEAVENQKKTQALIEAQKLQEVAEITKRQAVTQAQQRVEVAQQAQREADTMKAIAKIKADTAELDKLATIAAAEAKQKQIELGGGITDKDRVLAEIEANARVGVARELAKVAVPSTVITTGEKGGGLEALIQMTLLRTSGLVN